MFVISTSFGYFSTVGGHVQYAALGQDPGFGFDQTGIFADAFETEAEALKIVRALFSVLPSHILQARIVQRG